MRVKHLAWLLLVLPLDALGSPLPARLGYSFYVDGQPVGRADISVVQTAKSLRFESTTRVQLGPTLIELTSRTEADPRTFAVREFSYKGTKGGRAVESQVFVLGDSVYGRFTAPDGRREKGLKLSEPRTVVFEDWVMELEILLALTQSLSKNKADTYGLVFANAMLPANATAGYTGDVLVEAGPRSLAARKLLVSIRGAEPFESHVDPERGVPVYLRFPAVRAEVFLDEVFGDRPVTHFRTK